MFKLLRLFVGKPALLILLLTWGASAWAAEVAIKKALETAQAHTPGKVVAHEKADVPVDSKTPQPVYRIKILNQQGVMKTLLIHRQTGLVIK